MIPNECIILGGGNSINSVDRELLKSKLKNKFVIALNYAYKYFDHTFLACTDRDFYYPTQDCIANNYKCHPFIHNELKSLPLIISVNQNNIVEFKHPNTILLDVTDTYYREQSKEKGFFIGTLTGKFALGLALYLMNYTGRIFLCYSDDTEVFTNQGWKLFKDLNKTEQILTRKSNGETEWSPILNYFEYDYNGKMKYVKSKGIDLLVTPDHSQCLIPHCKKRCLYCNQKRMCKDGYFFKPIKNLSVNQQKIPKTFKWNGANNKYFVLDGYTKTYWQNIPYNQKGKMQFKKHLITKNVKYITIKITDWCAFLGLYLSDGCCLLNKNRTSHTVIIYQNHTPEKDKFITNILKKLPFKYGYHKRGWEVYSICLVNYLKNLGNSDKKYIPQEFKNLNKYYLKILLKSLMFGDGHIDTKRKTNYYFTVSKKLADDVQEIAYKCGFNAELYTRKGRACSLSTKLNNIGKTAYTVCFNDKHNQGSVGNIHAGNLVWKNKITDVDYTGKVYDITVNNHTLFVRRNNICVWSGNCGFDWDVRNPKSIDPKKYNAYDKNFKTHFYNDEHKGQGWLSFFENNPPDPQFKRYLEPKCKIFNVSPSSNINVFEKINYERMFSLIETEEHNQNELREEIKEILCT